ncbi:MAG: beta-ketoacyl synthase N-terminal-like domain-containing protein [Acidobacteriota bacterium]
MHEPRIAIVGLACQYPDAADSPDALWRNVLSQRRAFRRLPAERLRLDDYLDAEATSGVSPDTIYSSRAAVLHDYAFDRARFRIGGHSYRAADTTHWLALDVADAALADAGFEGGEGLPRDETSVVIGNSLTGEFTRAGLMRLRWPYVRRQTRAVLRADGLDEAHVETLLEALERQYKTPFPEPSDESLAGGLANTIAGRIANQFDLHGGGFTVDGACASSLLAVTQACSALAMGDVSVALAGGVDLSIDPFELVGFARTGALARDEMRVFDRRPTGFIPGEGCGIVVLMRLDDALAQGRRIYAVARGWGVSSDGHGGLTRPETEGQLLALRRAYRRAGFGPDTVGHFEAHGTGTAVGDVAELTTLDRARREAGARDRAAVSTIKGQIGHTKAAAGVAGLIKATLAVHHQVLPPTPGCHDLHDQLRRDDATLRVLDTPEAWPTSTPLRAAASAMGFGGINTHVVFEGVQNVRRRDLVAVEHTLARTPQDAELLVLSATDSAALADRARTLAERVAVA